MGFYLMHHHYYVYYFTRDVYVFERTCGTKEAAVDRVAELQRRGYDAVFLVDHTIRGAFY